MAKRSASKILILIKFVLEFLSFILSCIALVIRYENIAVGMNPNYNNDPLYYNNNQDYVDADRL